MLVGNKHVFRKVKHLNLTEKDLIICFMQGAIYSWVKNRKGEWFAVRDLVGGDNYYWEGTPLEKLWLKQTKLLGKTGNKAIKGAAKDLGWLTKQLIHDNKRTFETKKSGLVRVYRWTGTEGL